MKKKTYIIIGTLIFILGIAMCSVAFGQIDTVKTLNALEFSEMVNRTYEKMQYNNLGITRGLILEYSEECYNDSVRIHTYKVKLGSFCYFRINNQLKLVCKKPNHFDYIHPTPTFEGFIKWFKQ